MYELLWWQNSHVLIISFSSVSIQGSGEDIWSHVGLSRYVMNSEVIFLQVCMPSGCSAVEVLGGLPVLEVCMIGEDDKGEFCPSQVVLPVG
jgi:hypothetical protein